MCSSCIRSQPLNSPLTLPPLSLQDSQTPQPIYIDTYSGLLAYKTPFPPGAIFVDFVHLGHGTQAYFEGDGAYSGNFGTLSSTLPDLWSACGTSGVEFQVYAAVSVIGGTPDTSLCTIVSLSALDYAGPSPAVDSYD